MSLSFERLVEFIKNDLAVDGVDIGEQTPLFSSGLIDSFSLVSLMSFLEKEQGIVIAPTDINLDNFDTVRGMLNFINRASQNDDVQAAS